MGEHRAKCGQTISMFRFSFADVQYTRMLGIERTFNKQYSHILPFRFGLRWAIYFRWQYCVICVCVSSLFVDILNFRFTAEWYSPFRRYAWMARNNGGWIGIECWMMSQYMNNFCHHFVRMERTYPVQHSKRLNRQAMRELMLRCEHHIHNVWVSL